MSDILTDRERILLKVIDRLSGTQLLARGRNYYPHDFPDGLVHFAYYKDPEPGDLVLAKTGGVGRWKVGFYHQKLDGSRALIREIGSDALCDYGNESFLPIVGLSPTDLLEGERYKIYLKVLGAFRKGDEYVYRFGGLDFEGEEIIIWVREVFGGFGKDSKPFSIRMKWNKRTSVKAILEAMRQGGYGTRSFRPEPSELLSEQV